MLQLYKNQVVTSVVKKQVEIQQMELDWYTNNYWTFAKQGALLAGFSFSQITSPLPPDTEPLLESTYLLLVTVSLGMQLCVVVTTTFCCMWGPGLALRGPAGAQSVSIAVENMRNEQLKVFFFFFTGLVTFFLSNLLLVWSYYPAWIALIACSALGTYLALIFYFTFSLYWQLGVDAEDAVESRVDALAAYKNIGDLDGALIRQASQANTITEQSLHDNASAQGGMYGANSSNTQGPGLSGSPSGFFQGFADMFSRETLSPTLPAIDMKRSNF